MSPKALVAHIKALYPHPTKAPRPGIINPLDYSLDCYCVGGAFCRYAMSQGYKFNSQYTEYLHPEMFPPTYELAKVIMEFNPAISNIRAQDFAYAITGANDEGCYPIAWRYLEDALSFRW